MTANRLFHLSTPALAVASHHRRMRLKLGEFPPAGGVNLNRPNGRNAEDHRPALMDIPRAVQQIKTAAEACIDIKGSGRGWLAALAVGRAHLRELATPESRISCPSSTRRWPRTTTMLRPEVSSAWPATDAMRYDWVGDDGARSAGRHPRSAGGFGAGSTPDH